MAIFFTFFSFVSSSQIDETFADDRGPREVGSSSCGSERSLFARFFVFCDCIAIAIQQ